MDAFAWSTIATGRKQKIRLRANGWCRLDSLEPKSSEVVCDQSGEEQRILQSYRTTRKVTPVVATFLVDLVAGRLDQRQVISGGTEPGVDHRRMGRPDRGNTGGLPGIAATQGTDQCTAIQASRSARKAAPSIGPLTITARAPAALAVRRAWVGFNPCSQQASRTAPKQSPAPVGST